MYLHLRAHVGKDCWLDVVATAFVNSFATQVDSRTLLNTRIDVSQDLVVLHLAVLGSLIRALLEWMSYCDVGHGLGKLG